MFTLKSNSFTFRHITVCFCLVLVLTLTMAVGQMKTASASAPGVDQVSALALLNMDRTKNGLAPLIYNAELAKLAEAYAEDMINRQFFAHNNPEGLTPFDRMNRNGISYRHAGENLAVNDSVGAAQIAFMNSPTHRENILNPNFTEVGIGVKVASNGKYYVVQEFIGH